MNQPLFAIGEFSRITGITVKALRHYHEEGLLSPTLIDPGSGYRYYGEDKIEVARTIAFLRGLEFSLADIRELLARGTQEGAILQAMERHRDSLKEKIRNFKTAVAAVERFISEERQANVMSEKTFAVEEKNLEPALIAGVRMRGRYDQCGKGFGRIGRELGRYICGKPMLLHYDHEYREEDADFEAAMPVRRPKSAADGVDVRDLPGGRCVSLLHKGPYDSLGRSYAIILKYVKERGLKIATPTREVYLKGPGMIFKGNPKNYLTEIQMLVER